MECAVLVHQYETVFYTPTNEIRAEGYAGGHLVSGRSVGERACPKLLQQFSSNLNDPCFT